MKRFAKRLIGILSAILGAVLFTLWLWQWTGEISNQAAHTAYDGFGFPMPYGDSVGPFSFFSGIEGLFNLWNYPHHVFSSFGLFVAFGGFFGLGCRLIVESLAIKE